MTEPDAPPGSWAAKAWVRTKGALGLLVNNASVFEDDRADATLTTFPPDAFMMELARATQRLYYPELLPDANRPLDLPGSNAADRPAGERVKIRSAVVSHVHGWRAETTHARRAMN